MASLVAYAVGVRTARMTAVRDAIDAGSGAGKWRVYDGTRPATGGTATTLLAELVCSDPSGTVTSGVLTFSTITTDSSADNPGVATWARIVDSTGTMVVDVNVPSDLNLNTTTIAAGVAVSITGTTTLTDGSS